MGKRSNNNHIIHSRHAIVLDAGSTGSRIHIYEFQYCGDVLLVLSDEVFYEVKPGLSQYHEEPEEAGRSLKPLLERALARVPDFLQYCTPLTLKATAGLRLLPEKSVDAIMDSVRRFLKDHPFLLHSAKDSNDGRETVSVMDGSEEGFPHFLRMTDSA